MVKVPQFFRNTGEGSTTNYDFFDVADGIGYVTLYPSMNQSSSGALLKSQAYSDKLSTIASISSTGSYAKDIDIDWDTTINKPITIRGTTIFNFPLINSGAAAGQTADVFIAAKVRKFDGTTETDIAVASSAIIRFTGSGATYSHLPMVLVTVSTPLTKFKKGEILRMTTEVWAQKSGGAGGASEIGHDPQNRSATTFPITGTTTAFPSTAVTQARIFMPVVIDL